MIESDYAVPGSVDPWFWGPRPFSSPVDEPGNPNPAAVPALILGATGGEPPASNAERAGGETLNSRIQCLLSLMCLMALGPIGCPLLGQQAPHPTQPALQSTSAVATNGQGVVGHVTRTPYSADKITVTTQTLADGTKMTHKNLIKMYLDSQGRSREEWFNDTDSAGSNDSPQWVGIFDPVAGVSYRLDPRDHTAQRTETRRPGLSPVRQAAGASATPSPARPVSPQPTREDLGTQVIEGLEARGMRITRTIPEGAAGNDRPIQITDEIWHSAQPSLVLMRVTNDPMSGESVMHLSNLVLDEPPAELFQVPADYTIQELQPVSKPESPSD